MCALKKLCAWIFECLLRRLRQCFFFSFLFCCHKILHLPTHSNKCLSQKRSNASNEKKASVWIVFFNFFSLYLSRCYYFMCIYKISFESIYSFENRYTLNDVILYCLRRMNCMCACRWCMTSMHKMLLCFW